MQELVSHYRILEKLGAGGMGEVYLAEDTRLNRKVAVKFIQPSSAAGGEANRRLLREAQAAARLDHPNICAIYEVGEEDGRRFIVMQYVEGVTLDRHIKSQPLDLHQTLAIAAEVADALRDAHAHGIIHRDIKPSNIIVTPRGQAKVLDFGLARLAAGDAQVDAETQSALTAPDAVIGTVPYMSPEQVKGEHIDARSDIFSFGVTVYEAATGQRPFASESPAATASAILTHQPPPLARFSADVPDELQRIVGKCLEKDRERRYQSAADLVLDLEHLRRETQLRQSSAPTASIVAAPRQRTRRTSVMLPVMLAALLVAGAVYLLRQLRTPTVPVNAIGSIAVLPFANASGDQNTEYLSDGITESLINHFSQLPKLRVMARTTVFRYRDRNIDPRIVGRELAVDGVLTGRVLQRGDTLAVQADLVRVSDGSQLWGDRFDRKLTDLLVIQDEIAKQIADRLRGRLTGEEQQLITKRYTESTEAYDLYLKGRYFYAKLTEEGLDRSIAYYRQAIAIDPGYALAYVGLANSHASLGGVFGFRSPRETLTQGQQFAIKAVELDPGLADAHTALANYKLTYEWNWSAADQEIRRAIELNPNDGIAHQFFGTYYNILSRFDEAMAERKLARTLDPLSPFATANVGYPSYYARRYDEAIEHFRKALDLDPNYSWAHLWIGQAYVQKGMHTEAIAAIGRAIRLSGGDTRARATLGHAYGVAGKRDEAANILRELKTLSGEKYVSPYFMALVYVGLKEDDQAITSLEAAYQERHPYLTFLKVEPVFDRLRADSRFIELEKRVGLP